MYLFILELKYFKDYELKRNMLIDNDFKEKKVRIYLGSKYIYIRYIILKLSMPYFINMLIR